MGRVARLVSSALIRICSAVDLKKIGIDPYSHDYS